MSTEIKCVNMAIYFYFFFLSNFVHWDFHIRAKYCYYMCVTYVIALHIFIGNRKSDNGRTYTSIVNSSHWLVSHVIRQRKKKQNIFVAFCLWIIINIDASGAQSRAKALEILFALNITTIFATTSSSLLPEKEKPAAGRIVGVCGLLAICC